MENVTALDIFIQKYLEQHQNDNTPLTVQFDSKHISPCHVEQAEEGEWVDWRPVRQPKANHLSDLEHALQLKIDGQLSDFFTAYYSEHLNAHYEKGNLQLLMPWNQDDFERFQQNLIGHVLMKRRLKQRDTLFFAVTDEDDFIITVLNDTGQVMLEQVGLEPQEVLAESLNAFISQLTPVSYGSDTQG